MENARESNSERKEKETIQTGEGKEGSCKQPSEHPVLGSKRMEFKPWEGSLT